MNRKAAPFLTFAVIQTVYHLLMVENPLLDGLRYFAHALDDYSLLGFLRMRYLTWSSRVVVEGAAALLARNLILWKIADTLVWLLLLYAFSLLLGTFPKRGEAEPEKTTMNWFLVAGLLCYPILEMSSAGWIATMMNYAWALSFGAYALTVPVRLLRNEAVPRASYPLGVVALIYACNVEQAAAVLLGILLLLLLYAWVEKANGRILFICYLGIDLAGLLLTLLCPGNQARSASEIADGIRDFSMLGTVDKIYLGFTDTMQNLLSFNRLLLFVTGILFLLVLTKFRQVPYSIIALVPLLMTARIGTFGGFFQNYLSVQDSEELLNAENYMQPRGYLPQIFYLVFLFCLAVEIALLSESRAEWLMQSGLIVLGLLSRIVMGFSPSLYASGTRTMIYLHFTLLFPTLYFLWKERSLLRTPGKSGLVLRLFAAALGIFGTFNSLSFISVWG